MKLSEIEKYVKINGLEKVYNKSLNKNKINAARNSFYSVRMVDDFLKTGAFVSFINYYNYLSSRFTNHEGFISYLQEKAIRWVQLENNGHSEPIINEKDATIYLLKIFVINPIKGRIKEDNVENKIKKVFSDLTLSHPTPEEDQEECWDLKLEKDGIEFYIQTKPYSFFASLDSTSKDSFLKIKNASEKYNLPIFLVSEKQGKVYLYIREKGTQDNNCIFLPLTKFRYDLLDQEQINTLASKTFDNITETITTEK